MPVFYVVRHAETDWNKEHKILGKSQQPLSPSAKKTLSLVAQSLRGKNIHQIFTSNILRAEQSAIVLANQLHITTITKTPLLQEVDYGLLVGMKKTFAKKKFPAYHKDPLFKHPHGESFQQMYDRVTNYLELLASQTQENALLVTHAGCIRAIYAYCLGEPFENHISIKLNHTSILQCVKDTTGWKVVFLDD